MMSPCSNHQRANFYPCARSRSAMTRLAYILAASHSGSTLLSMLLGAHEQIATVGEMKFSRKAMGDVNCYRCSCGAFINECGFWQQIKQGMARRGFAFDVADAGMDYRAVESWYVQRLMGAMVRGGASEQLRDLALWLSRTWRRQLSVIHRRNAAFAATVCDIAGAKLVVDSSKIGLRLKYLLRNPELDVRIIRLVRDGRAVTLTYMDPANFADAEDPGRRAGGMGGNRANERLSIAQAACQWQRSMKEAEHILTGLDRSRWIEVRYEDYCSDPDVVLDRVNRFLGVEPSKQWQDFRAAEQHVIGNGMRLDKTSEIQQDDRWRVALTGDDLRTFSEIAGETNHRYGYI